MCDQCSIPSGPHEHPSIEGLDPKTFFQETIGHGERVLVCTLDGMSYAVDLTERFATHVRSHFQDPAPIDPMETPEIEATTDERSPTPPAPVLKPTRSQLPGRKIIGRIHREFVDKEGRIRVNFKLPPTLLAKKEKLGKPLSAFVREAWAKRGKSPHQLVATKGPRTQTCTFFTPDDVEAIILFEKPKESGGLGLDFDAWCYAVLSAKIDAK